MKAVPLTKAYPLRSDGPAKHVLLRSREGITLIAGLQPGQFLPPHRHPGHRLQVLVVQGQGRFSLQGNEQTAAAPAVLTFGGDVEFGVQNDGPEPLYVLVMLRPEPDA